MPEISVILKVDDGNRYLQEAVNNVFMQSFSDFELLVLKEGANYEDTLDGMDAIDMRLRILNVVSFEEPGVWGQVMESINFIPIFLLWRTIEMLMFVVPGLRKMEIPE